MKTLFFEKKPPADPELELLKKELLAAQTDLQQAYCLFNQAVDPELVESCIYEINAVKTRCNYLIRRIKARCPTAGEAAAAAVKEDAAWT